MSEAAFIYIPDVNIHKLWISESVHLSLKKNSVFYLLCIDKKPAHKQFSLQYIDRENSPI